MISKNILLVIGEPLQLKVIKNVKTLVYHLTKKGHSKDLTTNFEHQKKDGKEKN